MIEQRQINTLRGILKPLKGHRMHAAAMRAVLTAYNERGFFAASEKANEIVWEFEDSALMAEVRKAG